MQGFFISNKEIFLRELVSNASDALDKIRFKSIENAKLLGEDADLQININLNAQNNTVTISDNGIGMNEEELIANKQLYVHYAQDLNKNPSLAQFEDNSFDIITNVVSVDYLTKPLEIFKEISPI